MAKVQPGDLIEIGRRLRRLMADYDAVGYSLDGTLAHIDPALETRASALRSATRQVAALVQDFLAELEKHPQFTAERQARLRERICR